jgi:large subunit ribosomal protein L5
MRIRTDDHVMVTSGKDKGKQGKVIRVDPKRRRVFVEGVNIVKRHQRPRSMSDAQTGQAGIIDKEGPIDVSNVILLDPTDNQPTRVGVRTGDDGKRVRYSKRTDKTIDGPSGPMEAATQTPEKTESQAAPPARLRDRYQNEVLPALIEKFGYSTPMSAPRLVKVTVNMGIGEASRTSNVIDDATGELATITGQRPSVRRARKSIAAFKLREGMPVGVAVTLRKARMWEFTDRQVSIAIPRIRDFRGLNPRSFDGRGNYSLGIREQLIFPEIDYDSISDTRGLDITFATTAASDEEGFELLLGLGFPFAQEGRPGGRSQEEIDAEEEEHRKEEARQRAEAEQAALEQLKEENPEAYEKPAADEDAEGEEGESGSNDGQEEE